MDYYRVRSAHKLWTDNGPDLLRTPVNTKATLRALVRGEARLSTRYEARDGAMTEWRDATRQQVIARLGVWMDDARDNGAFQVATGKEPELAAIVRKERVPYVELPHCSRATSVAWSLIHYHFGGKVVLSGAFLYRQIDGSTEWSDHAWGTADDVSPTGGLTNDALFDWNVRMARERCMDVDYILGSIGGHVKSASAPDFDVQASGAAVSHTWHNHLSIVDHDGARPPRNPMYR